MSKEEPQRPATVPDWLVLVGYFAGVLVLGAALTPPIHGLGQWFVEGFADSPLRENAIVADLYKSVERSPFTRYFDRGILVAALVLLWPALRLLRRGERGLGMGLEPNPDRWTHWAFGFLLAAGSLLALGHWLCSREMFLLDPEAGGLASLWVGPLLTAVVVAVLEEFLFRGGMLGLLLRSMGTLRAVLVVSGIFAIVHFLHAPEQFAIRNDEVNAASGFVLLGQMLGNLGNAKVVLAELLLLFVVGLILASVRIRSRSLWMPMGLHAGWVFGVQLYAEATEPTRSLEEGVHLPWMGDDLKVGVVPLAIVLLTWFLSERFLKATGSARPRLES